MFMNANLVAVTPGGEITEDQLAGEFFFYTIPETMVDLDLVRTAFEEFGLDTTRLPKARRLEHVVQEACRKVERVVTNGRRVEIRAEQVLRDPTALVYQITRHMQDKENRVIEHPKAMRVVLTFADRKLTFDPLGDATEDDIKPLVDEINAHIAANLAKLNGNKIRTILRHYVEDAGAENMRGGAGGVYFLATKDLIPTRTTTNVPMNGRQFLTAIVNTLGKIYDVPEFHRIPCINDEGQREFLKRKFMENCSTELESYRDELLALVRDKDKRTRGFRQDKVNNLIERKRMIDERRKRFAGVLDDTLSELDQNMQLADAALAAFLAETVEVVDA